MKKQLLTVENLTKNFPSKIYDFFAIDQVTFSIDYGDTVGLVGNSGCGKSTLAKILLRLTDPDSGSIYFEGKNLLTLDKKDLKKVRKNIQMIFQDPSSSLNPRMNIFHLLAEPFIVHNLEYSEASIDRLLDLVGLAKSAKKKYPHEFSGGQKQRIGIARALALNPTFLICDEPTSALDISIQAQILNLLKDLKKEKNLTYLFIGHNLAVIRHISSKVMVMHEGKIVEQNDTESLFQNPQSIYTKRLIDTAFYLNPDYETTERSGLGRLKTTSSFV